MPWQSKYRARFVKPLVAQVMAIIRRDIAAALADVNPAAKYPAFAQYDLSLLPVINFPAILLLPQSVEFDKDAQETRHYSVRLYCSLAVRHQDPNQVAGILEDYIAAVDEVLNSAWELTPGDFYRTDLELPSPPWPAGALSPGLQAGSLMFLFSEGHAYDEMRRVSQGLFAKTATCSILCELEET